MTKKITSIDELLARMTINSEKLGQTTSEYMLHAGHILAVCHIENLKKDGKKIPKILGTMTENQFRIAGYSQDDLFTAGYILAVVQLTKLITEETDIAKADQPEPTEVLSFNGNVIKASKKSSLFDEYYKLDYQGMRQPDAIFKAIQMLENGGKSKFRAIDVYHELFKKKSVANFTTTLSNKLKSRVSSVLARLAEEDSIRRLEPGLYERVVH